MEDLTINGKPAVKINAHKIMSTKEALYLKCEGDEVWMPKSQCEFNNQENTVLVSEWFYNNKFPD